MKKIIIKKPEVLSLVIFAFIFVFNTVLISSVFSSDDISLTTIPNKGKKGKIDSVIKELIGKFSAKGLPEAQKFASERNIKLKNNKVEVILTLVDGSSIDNNALSSLGVEVDKSYDNLIKAYVPIYRLKTLESKFPEIQRIRLPFKPLELHTSEGVSLTGASSWQTSGYKGAGLKIAVIDLGFDNLTETKAHGDLPSTVITHDYTGAGLETDTVHGTAVAEAVYDMAPDAQLYLYKIGDEVDLAAAKNDSITNGINIINHSVGWVNTGAYNGTGIICNIANDARTNGILWVNSAGNYAAKHYEGIFTDTDGDGWHQYISSPVDEINWISASAGEYISVFLSWDDWYPSVDSPASCEDYDLYLTNSSGTTIITGSANGQDCSLGSSPTEGFYYLVPPGGSGSYGIIIENFSTTRNCDMKLYTFRHDLQSNNRTPSGSFMSPADATGVMAVGAIASSSWTTGPQESFSSKGPTTNWNGATPRIKPDIAGPDNVDSFTYGHWFGTSASSPHVAGAAALVWQRFPSFTVNQVQSYLEGNAIDMGTAGKDNIYGSGRLNLPSGPTLISLSSFTATESNSKKNNIAQQKKKRVILDWSTESEIDNLGFNILRSNAENGKYTKINKKIIIARGNKLNGASYRFIDKKASYGKIYWYKLEDINNRGESTIYGPILIK